MNDTDKAYSRMRRTRGKAARANKMEWGYCLGAQAPVLGPPVRRICPRCQTNALSLTEGKCERCTTYLKVGLQ